VTDLDPQVLSDALSDLAARKYALLLWLAVSVLAGAAVRLCKSDSPIPFLAKVPPVWRTYLAYFFGFVAAACMKLATGIPWQTVLTLALGGGTTAIAGHEVVVEGMRGGREFFAKKGAPIGGGSASKPPAAPPPSVPGVLRGSTLIAFALALAACAGGASVVPSASALAQCISNVAAKYSPSANFVAFLAAATLNCDTDLVAVLNAIINSTDPNVNPLAPQAQAALADAVKMSDLRSKVSAYGAAHPELHK
jgi:hypothetical protein